MSKTISITDADDIDILKDDDIIVLDEIEQMVYKTSTDK